MTTKYFTVEEANALLSEIAPLVEALVTHQAKIGNTAKSVAPMLVRTWGKGGTATPETTELHQAFLEVEQLTNQIKSFGVIVKNANVGLIDFLADFNGRDVYLCWKYGEPTITHYHDLHTGFNGRKPLP